MKFNIIRGNKNNSTLDHKTTNKFNKEVQKLILTEESSISLHGKNINRGAAMMEKRAFIRKEVFGKEVHIT
jgi:hypothetical protein